MSHIDQEKGSAVAQILSEFEATADLSYKKFNTKLKTTIYPNTILGIKMPIIRKTALKLSRLLSTNESIAILRPLANHWYEYKLLLGLVLKETATIDQAEKIINLLYDLCDGWATPDLFQEVLRELIKIGGGGIVVKSAKKQANNPNQFARRLSIVSYFPLLKLRQVTIKETIAHTKLFADDTTYYVEMAIAWLLAEIKLTHPLTTININSPTLLKKYHQKLRDSTRNKS